MSEEQVYEFVKMIAGLSTVEYGAVPQLKALKRTANRLLPDMSRPPVDSVGVDRVGEIMAYATGALCGLDGTGKGDEGVIEIMLEAERRIAALADSTGEGT